MANTTPTGASAQIITHPRFDRPAVVQHPRRGRFPRTVISYWGKRADLAAKQYHQDQVVEKIKTLQGGIDFYESWIRLSRAEIAGLRAGARIKGYANV